MSLIDSVVLKEPIKQQVLTIILDEDDDVYFSIKQSMLDHQISKCTVTTCNGKLKDAVINCFERNNYKKIEFKDKQILKVSGEFKLNKNEMFGTLKIFTDGKVPIQGTLCKGIASQNFTLNLTFIR